MGAETGLLDLPVELLLQVFSYLEVSSFLSLTSTCQALHNPEFVHDAAYWSTLVRTTFRVPNQPVVEKDGERWQKLFKRMLTQSRIYTWGNNEKACLGHSFDIPDTVRRAGPMRRRHISWPEKMQHVKDLGVISDLQCGGWSTTLLTATGALYTVGVIDGLWHTVRPPLRMQRTMVEPVPLRYPPGFPHPYDRYEASTAIKQFSSGRSHVLALSDSGRIWSWQNIEHAALHVKFLQHDTTEKGNSNGRGVLRKVVAGWNKSAVLIEGTGIVLWEPLQRTQGDNELEDTALVIESIVVPKTNCKATGKLNGNTLETGATNDDFIGEVVNFIVLEELVIFNTASGKVYVAQIFWTDHDQRVADPVQLPLGDSEEPVFATDVQGSYNSFGIFTKSGAVLTSTQDRVIDLLQNSGQQQQLFTRIPALQHRDVIQLAFGDYHFHALHAPGYITSYGTEPQHCGALGLGGLDSPEGRLRGIRYQSAGGDGRLVPHAYAEGRRVWFQKAKRAWIKFLTSGGVDAAESVERVRMAIGSQGIRCQGEVSEWVEQQGRDWESKLGLSDDDEDGFGAYFAMSVTAAGWHSGALVLVNEELAEKVKRACEVPGPTASSTVPHMDEEHAAAPNESEREPGITSWLYDSATSIGLDWGRWFLGLPPYDAASAPSAGNDSSAEHMGSFQRGTHPLNYGASPRVGFTYRWATDHFPRLKLSDGTEMPGVGPFDEWRYPRPEWDLHFTL